ncbi:hypothetical protein B0T17DRAFT_541810 [Bombardia bombarda]|uniref:Uncharacterized protein n=1 Tax=Bombardia bombarda TaxID=252184 RepID=A0AA39TPY6_9PEZI|nr:hypothetical protein B0T17DRAFT_541810 [Bombardia bombarda]
MVAKAKQFQEQQNPAPFSINILAQDDGDDAQSQGDQLLSQFPASYRTTGDKLFAPKPPEPALIAQELNLKRLHDIVNLLWFAGPQLPPRPLHFQLHFGRDIVVTEVMDNHLVWGSGKIYLKPIPRYLLNPRFWADHLSCDLCRQGCDSDIEVGVPSPPSCQHQKLRQCALGFLLSYVALIGHESDLSIAQGRYLIPAEVTWPRWRIFVRQILDNGGASASAMRSMVAPRFVYGELRLDVLNLITVVLQGPLSSGFMTTWNSSGNLFRDHLGWIVSVPTAYVVGLMLDTYHAGFGPRSYGLGVFFILYLIGCLMLAVPLLVIPSVQFIMHIWLGV